MILNDSAKIEFENGSLCDGTAAISKSKVVESSNISKDTHNLTTNKLELEHPEAGVSDDRAEQIFNEQGEETKSNFDENRKSISTITDLDVTALKKKLLDEFNKNNVYLRSNLLKLSRDENNEVVVYVPCKLNMDLESLFYYFSDNSIFLNCEQFSNMLHCSKLYHKSRPIDILERMFPENQRELSLTSKRIEYNSFIKLLHKFSQFKFRSTGATEQEKLNLVISFLLNCDIIDVISTKLIKADKCIQVSDPTIQRKEKEIQAENSKKDSFTQSEKKNTCEIGIDATCKKLDVCCECNFDNKVIQYFTKEKVIESKRMENELNVEKKYHIESVYGNNDIAHNKGVYEIENKYEKKVENISQKKSCKQRETESEILPVIKNISEEDDKKLYRIFVYYTGPNNDRLSYRQFYNLVNDSGLLGGNFEEFLTPAQIERCYSAVLIDPKGVDYWEFKEILLYCGEISFCGNNPISAFQNIVKKYIIPLILTIYQPNNFEKCEDAVTNENIPDDVELKNIKSLQSMINKAILPWFRLGKQPFLVESDENSGSCCSSDDYVTSLSEKSGYSSDSFSQKSSIYCENYSVSDESEEC